MKSVFKRFSTIFDIPAYFLALFVLATISMPAAAQNSMAYGFFAKGKTAAGISVYPARSNQTRSGIFTLVAHDIDDCLSQFPRQQIWSDLCSLANRSEKKTLRLVYTVAPEKGPMEMSGQVTAEVLNFPFFLALRFNSDDRLLTLAAFSQWTGDRTAISFSDSQKKFMAIKDMSANFNTISAQLQSGGVKSTISVERLSDDNAYIGNLNFSFDGSLGKSCEEALGKSTQQAGWIRLCETADKDGSIFLRGTLNPIDNGTAYAGTVTLSTNGQRYQLMVSSPRDDYAMVAVRPVTEPAFMTANVTENIIFDSQITISPSQQSGTPNLVGRVWKVPQEDLPNFGMEMEVQFEQNSAGYSAKAIGWYRADTDNITGYCYETTAMQAICEQIAKDGPLIFDLDLPTRISNVAFGLQGNAVATSDWHNDPFVADIYQGASIPDWGNEDPNAIYIRLSKPEITTGSEPVSWIKLEPIDKDIVTLDELAVLGTYNRPATNMPSTAQSSQKIDLNTTDADASVCQTVSKMITVLSDPKQRRQAMDVLTQAGFWGGILPEDEASCKSANQALTSAGFGTTVLKQKEDKIEERKNSRATPPQENKWPFYKTVKASKPLGNKQESIEIFMQSNGSPSVRIPSYERCFFSTQTTCEYIKLYPGEYPVQYMASSEGHTYGFFAIGSQGFILKLEDTGNGVIMAYISSWTEGLLPLGGLQ